MNKRHLLPAAVLVLMLSLLGLLVVTGPYPWFPFGLGDAPAPGSDAWWLRRAAPGRGTGIPDAGSAESEAAAAAAAKAKEAANAPKAVRSATESLLDELRRHATDPSVHNNEVILIFADAGAYTGFLNDAQRAGIAVTGRIAELYAVRVHFTVDDVLNEALDRALMLRDVQLVDLDLNWKMQLEEVVGVNTVAPQSYVRLLELLFQDPNLYFLGWGTGMRIAYLDTGLALNTAQFFPRLRQLDIGLGVEPDDRHGMALALLATAGPDLAEGLHGIATGAELLSVRVTDGQGIPDVFTVAQGLVAAANAGATFIEVSPYSSHDALVLKQALNYAIDLRGAAVIAARGIGDTPGWPAADRRVIAVGAIDAFGALPLVVGQGTLPVTGAPAIRSKAQVGPGLASEYVALESAPASAAIVTASLAAVMSVLPNTTPAEAWFLLQRNAVPGELTTLGPMGKGFRVLNLRWLLRVPPKKGWELAETPSLDLVDPSQGQDELAQMIEPGQPGQRPTQFLPGTSSGRSTIIRGPAPARGNNPTARGSAPARGGPITVTP
jgi:hypothetical protein